MAKQELGPGAYGDPENPEQTREEYIAADKAARREERKAEREAEKAEQSSSSA